MGVFLIVALRTASMNSEAVGTGVMPCRPATEDIAAGTGWGLRLEWKVQRWMGVGMSRRGKGGGGEET